MVHREGGLMAWWVIPMPVVAIAVVVYGITTHRRWVWAIAGAYVVVSLLLFLFLGGLGHGGAGYTLTPPSP